MPRFVCWIMAVPQLFGGPHGQALLQRAPKDSNLRPSDSKSAQGEVSERLLSGNTLVRPPGDSSGGPLIQGACPDAVPPFGQPSKWLDRSLADAMLSMALKGMAARIALSFRSESGASLGRGRA